MLILFPPGFFFPHAAVSMPLCFFPPHGFLWLPFFSIVFPLVFPLVFPTVSRGAFPCIPMVLSPMVGLVLDHHFSPAGVGFLGALGEDGAFLRGAAEGAAVPGRGRGSHPWGGVDGGRGGWGWVGGGRGGWGWMRVDWGGWVGVDGAPGCWCS